MIQKYGSSAEEGKRYFSDLRYWSNACGELHECGTCDIEEKDLPEALKGIYRDWWEEGKDGHNCYLAEYKGRYGIALINEYHEVLDGEPCSCNYEEASKDAELLDKEFSDKGIVILLAKELGFPHGDDCASEVVVFVPATVDKGIFEQVSKRFAEIAEEKR